MSNTITIPTITVTGTTNPGIPSPWQAPDQWDSINVAGTGWGWAYSSLNQPLVGSKVRVIGAKRKYKLEVKLPQGADGWVTVYRGIKVVPFDLLFTIVTSEQLSYFVTNMLPIFKFSGVKDSPNPAACQSLAIYHPALSALDISAILVEEIGAIEPKEDGPNEFTCKIRVVEYLQPPDQNTSVVLSGTTPITQATSPGQQTQPAITQRQTAYGNQITVASGAGQ
jgi:hypothetical protein